METIRRDVEQDSTGLIRRYLRLSEKVLDRQPVEQLEREAPQESSEPQISITTRAA